MFQTLKTNFSPLFKPLNLWVLLLVSFLAAATGPFGTYETHSILLRFLYWSSVTGISMLIGHGCHRLARVFVDEYRPVTTDVVMTALMILFFTPVLWALSVGILNFEPGAEPTLAELSVFVATITSAVCVARRVLPGYEPVGYFGAPEPESPDPPRLLRRLPPEFQGPVLRLAVRDHFVDVVSDGVTHTLRMRFGDAIDEMDTVAGLCTHRSHWIVRDAIEGVERENGKINVRLTNGDLVPVSRKYKTELEDAGLL